MSDEPPIPLLPQSVYKWKPDDWQPPGHNPLTWRPPEKALRKFARRQAEEERPVFLPLSRWAQANWFCLCVGLLEDQWLLSELSTEEADTAIFGMSCDVGYASEWRAERKPSDLVTRFVAACVALYESDRAFHPDGHSKWMLWDNLGLTRQADPPGKGPLQDLLLGAMLRVLALEDPESKRAALHGLGHLKDERARPAIQALIDSTTDEELRQYALDAYHFRVL